MASPAYMSIIDDKGNTIRGLSRVAGRENQIEVYQFKHEVRIPTDTDTGALTATRKHENFIVIKDYCPASPILYKACSSGKTLNSLILSWYKVDDTGKEVEYFRHTLEGVKVVSVQAKVDDVKDKNNEYLGHREEVAFRYQKIKWTYLDGNIETEDEWRVR